MRTTRQLAEHTFVRAAQAIKLLAMQPARGRGDRRSAPSAAASWLEADCPRAPGAPGLAPQGAHLSRHTRFTGPWANPRTTIVRDKVGALR